MKTFAELDIENKGDYILLLKTIAKLSGLFSESSIPFINYRVAENIFCKAFNAENLSRSDTAYDAKINDKGIGIKTFVCPSSHSLEKIAEFNSLAGELQNLNELELARKLADFRNERINLAKRIYKISNSLYHIIARKNKELILFDTDYEEIDVSKIKNVKSTRAGIKFEDDKNQYSFNRSKSTLYRQFHIPSNAYNISIDILKDPYELLIELFKEKEEFVQDEKLIPGIDYLILPLYSYEKEEKFVFTKSGLNQWNAGGRKRDPNEVYIPVPTIIHHNFPDFFPAIKAKSKEHFLLHLPNGESFDASMCQTSEIEIKGERINKGKGLMTYSNKGLGEWILRDALQLNEGELVTYEMLENIEIDSVIIYKINSAEYKIDIQKTDSYENFKEKYLNS